MDTSPGQPIQPRPPVPPQTTPIVSPVPPRGGVPAWVWIALVVVVAIIIIMILFFALRSGDEGATQVPISATPSATPTPTSSPTPTPSPSPTVNPADWTFEVLNGSGVTGAAAKAAEVLKGRGYKVQNVGNAEEQNYEKTQLLVTSERSEAAQALLTDLKTVFPLNEVDATLESTSLTARLIIGKDWEPPTASPSASPKASPKATPSPTPSPQ